MAVNPFESSRIASGTLNPGAQKPGSAGPGASAHEPNEAADRKKHVLAASDVIGDCVRNPAGESLGIIEQIMLDVPDGRIAYGVLSFGGFLGVGDKLFAVPWSALKFDAERQEFVLDVDRRTLENAPGFNKHHFPDMADPSFKTAIHDYYGQDPAWEHNFTDAGDYIGNTPRHDRSIEHEPTAGYHPAGNSTKDNPTQDKGE